MTKPLPKQLPSQQELRDRFDYDLGTGVLTFKKLTDPKYSKTLRGMNIFNAKYAGKQAGSVNDEGYLKIQLPNGRSKYAAHRIIWKWVTGEEPGYHVDHRDGDNQNNRFENLRSHSDQTQNMQNRKLFKNNKSGRVGVKETRWGKWEATGRYEKQPYYLGKFDTFEEACLAREQWEEGKNFTERHGK